MLICVDLAGAGAEDTPGARYGGGPNQVRFNPGSTQVRPRFNPGSTQVQPRFNPGSTQVELRLNKIVFLLVLLPFANRVKSRARAAVSLFHLEPKQSSVQPCWLAHALFGFQRNFCSRILPQHCLTMEYAQKHAKQSPGAQNCSKQQQVKSHSSYQPQTSYSERSGGLTE